MYSTAVSRLGLESHPFSAANHQMARSVDEQRKVLLFFPAVKAL
jgi:hypothetical protein